MKKVQDTKELISKLAAVEVKLFAVRMHEVEMSPEEYMKLVRKRDRLERQLYK